MNVTPRLYATLPTLMGNSNRAVIDLAALCHNYRTLRAHAGDKRECICVLKADAYGHGACAVARALRGEGCRCFAVSCLEEALAVKQEVSDADILIFGRVPREQIPLVITHGLTATVYSVQSARTLSDEAERLGARIKVHIKLDTGMNRLGFAAYQDPPSEETLSELAALFSMKGLAVGGIYSHLAKADEPSESDTNRQAARFLAVTKALEQRGFALGVKHLCNSAGAMRFADKYGLDAVRLGIALYGYPPEETAHLGLLPVMRLESKITHIHTVPAHECVGYGGEFEADTPRTIATIGIGYADGWLRAYKGARVTLHTESGDFGATVVGRVCMDQCMLDVTGLPATCGDRVTLFGQTQAELLALAKMADTIPYECLCLISGRVLRAILAQ